MRTKRFNGAVVNEALGKKCPAIRHVLSDHPQYLIVAGLGIETALGRQLPRLPFEDLGPADWIALLLG